MSIESEKAKKKILIVDDDAELLEYVKTGLENSGFYVETTENPNSVMSILLKNDYNAMLLDMLFPEEYHMSGNDIVYMVKKYFKDIKIIMMTGHPDTKSRIEAMKEGVEHYLTKPFEIQEVVKILEECFCKNTNIEK